MSIPADWYPDPATPGQLRYWDGRTWTANVAPGASAPVGPQVDVLAPYRPAHALGVASLALTALICAFKVAELLFAWPAMEAMEESLLTLGQRNTSMTAYDGVAAAILLALLANYVVTCLWLWRMRQNAEGLNPQGRHARSRGWIWGAWICPVVSLWFPYQVVADIRAASGDRPRRGGLVGAWWAGFLVWVIMMNVTPRASLSADGYQFLGALEVVATAGCLVAAFCWFRIVQEIRADQDQAAARVSAPA